MEIEPNTDLPGVCRRTGQAVGELEGEVRAREPACRVFRTRVEKVIAQREEWKARALVAEQKVTDLTAQLANRRATRDDRFDALRRLVARNFTQTSATNGGIEKLIRAEFFKRLWPEIERLSEHGEA